MSEKKNYKILIVDDEIEYQNVLSFILSDEGYCVATCSNGTEALDYLEQNTVHLVLTDLKMPVMNGEELIRKIKASYDDIEIIVMTAFGSIESAVDSMKLGAIDYFVKTGEMIDLMTKVDRLSKISRLEQKNHILLDKQNAEELFVKSKNPAYIELLEMCERTANTNINILLLGESGVGKEVIANYIHSLSNRKNEPFVPINCQVFPEGIIESELFGHEKGAFTGALGTRIGKFEQANMGTLFLDEIGDLPIATQGKLLRAIESKKIERIGSNKSIDLDVRFISATNKDLLKQIENFTFREDLFYRINTLTLNIPPLRERKEDLEDLIQFFIHKTEIDQKKKIRTVDDEVMQFLLQYDYPGNVRELKNIVERMIALSSGGIVTAKELLVPLGTKKIPTDHTASQSLKEAREHFEKEHIQNALLINQGNVSKTAKQLHISTRQLWNKINQYQIQINK